MPHLFRGARAMDVGGRRYPDTADEPPPTYRGHPTLSDERCRGTGDCALACPTDALAVARRADGWTWKLDRAACTGCGVCLDACRSRALVASPSFELAAHSRADLLVTVTFHAVPERKHASRDGRP